jgi:hypothetical protein
MFFKKQPTKREQLINSIVRTFYACPDQFRAYPVETLQEWTLFVPNPGIVNYLHRIINQKKGA